MSEIIKMNVHYITHVNKNKSTSIFLIGQVYEKIKVSITLGNMVGSPILMNNNNNILRKDPSSE